MKTIVPFLLLLPCFAANAATLTANTSELRWLNVTNAVTLELTNMNGTVIKQGPETLTLSMTTHAPGKGQVEVRSGTLAISGQMWMRQPLPQAAITQAVFWVAADTNVVMTTANGTNSVTEWRDMRETATASPYAWPRAIRAYSAQSPVWNKNGLMPYVDFGRYGDSDNNKWLLWADSDGNRLAVTNIRHFFVVFACPNSFGTIFGDWTCATNGGTRDLMEGNPIGRYGTFFSPEPTVVNPFIINCTAVLNGVNITPTATYPHRDYQCLELITTGPVNASNFCNDRNFRIGDLNGAITLNRQGGVRLCEVLVFTNVLVAADRTTINTYLTQKWFAVRPEAVATQQGRITADVPEGEAHCVALSGNGKLRKTGSGSLARLNTAKQNGLRTVLEGGALQTDIQGAVQRQDGPLLVLESGSQTLTSEEFTVTRTSNVAAGTVTKAGSGVLLVGAISNGVSKVTVTEGTLALSPATVDPVNLTVLLTNGSFELHGDIPISGGWQYQRFPSAQAAGWTYTASTLNPAQGAGIACDNNSATHPFIGVGMVPDGNAVGFIDSNGALKTTVTVPQAGYYTVHFKAAPRADANFNDNQFYVVLGTSTSDVMTATFFVGGRSSIRFSNYRYSAWLQQAGTYNLIFQGKQEASYKCVVLDDIHVELEQEGVDILNGAGSFETVMALPRSDPAYPNGRYALEPTGTSWTFSSVTNSSSGGYLSASGLTSSFTPWVPQPVYEGQQSAWILNNAFVQRIVIYPATGLYRLSLFAGGSDYLSGSLVISINGNRLGYLSSASRSFNRYSFLLPRILSPGETQTLRFDGGSGGHISLDGVRIEQVVNGPIVTNNSFEEGSTVETNEVVFTPTGTGWSFEGEAGIAGYQSVIGSAASGKRMGFIKNLGCIAQPIVFPSNGFYELTFKAAALSKSASATEDRSAFHLMRLEFVRTGSTVTNTLGTVETRSQDYNEYTFRLPCAETNATYTLLFRGLNAGSRFSLLDDVTVQKLETVSPADAYPQTVELELAESARLNLDYSGSIKMLGLRYGTQVITGTISADTYPGFVTGSGALSVASRGTLVLLY